MKSYLVIGILTLQLPTLHEHFVKTRPDKIVTEEKMLLELESSKACHVLLNVVQGHW